MVFSEDFSNVEYIASITSASTSADFGAAVSDDAIVYPSGSGDVTF
ncbi:MAG: hypothetical protein R3Y51_02670 [Rikenellaceae bacterium]